MLAPLFWEVIQIITINNICKSFKERKVINGLSLTINDGIITALVGKNGCGKTTLIRLISKTLKPDCGNIINTDNNTGIFLGGDVRLYENLTGFENLQFFASMRKMSKSEFLKRYDELSEILNLKDFATEKALHYSRGMMQKIGFAISIIHNPSTIILDEPSTGLDLISANDVLQFLDYCKSQNKTIFISTHNISEISDLSDYMSVMKNGTIALYTPTKDFFKNTDGTEKTKKLAKFLEYDYDKSNNCDSY
ncbi:MAG: ABC transporter ATP-binding protein [Eubacterium sp.]